LALLVPVAVAKPALAHPHVWIDARSAVVFDSQQRVSALRLTWRFDEFYSLFAIEGLDSNSDGRLDPAELQPLAELNVTSLKEYDYFTEILADGEPLAFDDARDYSSRYEEGILSLTFEIPLAMPIDPRAARVRFRSYDPTFYIAIEPALQDPVAFAGTPPPSCRAVVEEDSAPPEVLTLSEADFADPAASQSIGKLYATTLAILCESAGMTQ
jgi:ABC-type uncharacterized transport system substrate-binding protein